MKKLFKMIPGFRSGDKWKKKIAIRYYLFCGVSLLGGISLMLFMLSLPFVIFSIVEILEKKELFKLYKQEERAEKIVAKKIAFKLVLSLIICIVSYSTILPIDYNNHGKNISSNVKMTSV